MQFYKKHYLAILIALFLVFFGHRLFADSVKFGDVIFFAVFSAALLILPAVELGDKILKLLQEMPMPVSCCHGRAGETLTFTYNDGGDKSAEAEIVAAGLTAPRVTAEQIQVLMDKLTWRYEHAEGSTSTFAHAYLGSFYLVTGHSACVSPENFNAALGVKYAREQAEGKARDKLWELEGYKLWASLAGNKAQ